jgi:hypothetical protein
MLGTLDRLTSRWWFYLILLLLMFVPPTYASRPYDPRLSGQVISAVMQNALIASLPAIYPAFKVFPIVLVVAILMWRDRATRWFDGYVAATLLLFALFQNAAVTQRYGLVILTGNVVVYAILALLWAWETILKANDFSTPVRVWWKYWVAPIAFLGFWFPLNVVNLQPDFSPLLILTSEAGLASCMMIPVYLAVVLVFEPDMNRPVVRATGFVGLVTALLNFLQWFVLEPHPWLGVLHLPLFLICAYALVVSLRAKPTPNFRRLPG